MQEHTNPQAFIFTRYLAQPGTGYQDIFALFGPNPPGNLRNLTVRQKIVGYPLLRGVGFSD